MRVAVVLATVFAGSFGVQPETSPLDAAYRLFYNGRFDESAAMCVALRSGAEYDIANDELRTTALLFQMRRLLVDADTRDDDKTVAWKACARCQELATQFTADLKHGQAAARAILKQRPTDERALFYLGKLDLNYVWLQLGLLGKKTGWDEYWEARHSLDAVLKANPKHVRAKVSRAWIDYIVSTRMAWGTRWLLGGGNKKKAIAALREAAAAETDWVSHAEAEFGLWDMLQRDKNTAGAHEVARRIAQRFPENADIAAFLRGRPAKN
jgi:hypothetical protein